MVEWWMDQKQEDWWMEIMEEAEKRLLKGG